MENNWNSGLTERVHADSIRVDRTSTIILCSQISGGNKFFKLITPTSGNQYCDTGRATIT